jgi:signal transduction histidine kinase
MTRRILLSYLSLTLAILLSLGIPLGSIYAHHERDGFAAAVERDAVVLAAEAQPDIAAARAAPIAALADVYATASGARVVVVAADGIPLAADGTRDVSRDPAISTALGNRHAVGYRSNPDNGSELYVAVPVRTGTAVTGAVLITYPTDLVDASATRFWAVLAASGTLTLIIVAITGFALARWITRPVRALEGAIAVIGHSADLPTADIGPPELRRLAARLTETSHRLHRLITAQRSFAAVASHQLRSPLTALRLRLENLEPELPAASHPDLDAAIAEVDRLTRMVQGLLVLAQLENTPADRVPADLDALVDERIDSWSAYAAENDVTLVRSPGRLGTALAVPGAVEQILDNLLSNALRAAPAHTSITIGAALPSPPGPTTEIHVLDQGPGLTQQERVSAFDRFWRAQRSPSDGTGLGLTIVRQLAQVSGGNAELRAAPGGGIDATVRLRRAPDGGPPSA